jgi:hypothetical protein
MKGNHSCFFACLNLYVADNLLYIIEEVLVLMLYNVVIDC